MKSLRNEIILEDSVMSVYTYRYQLFSTFDAAYKVALHELELGIFPSISIGVMSPNKEGQLVKVREYRYYYNNGTRVCDVL
jgi:hypothetical protein